MQVNNFVQILGATFFTGVPDSLLSPLADYLMDTYGEDPRHHIIAANEGNAVGIAAGYHLATGKVPCVYLQNSGEGNIVNPVASLLNEQVYGIPAIFIVGWRGEPGTKDEPQHAFQGEITISLLKELEVKTFVVTPETSPEELSKVMKVFEDALAAGRQVAFIIEKGALVNERKMEYKNEFHMLREDILEKILEAAGDDIIIATTGKTGREVFELREKKGQSHDRDFLTVGSMGHASSIALGIASQKPDSKIWCIDGDGAVLMHMGTMAVIGKQSPSNFIHVVINNHAHESVGGLPTAADTMDISKVAKACGYKKVIKVSEETKLIEALQSIKKYKGPILLEIESAIGSRPDLGRPTTGPKVNKAGFMRFML